MLFTDYSAVPQAYLKTAGDWCPVNAKDQPITDSALYLFSEREPVEVSRLLSELIDARAAAKKVEKPDAADLQAIDDLVCYASRQGRICRYRSRLRNVVEMARADSVADDDLRKWLEGALAKASA